MNSRGNGPGSNSEGEAPPLPQTRDLLRRAYDQIRSLRAELDMQRPSKPEPIAVIGLGCRFPGGVRDADSLWRLIRDGVDTVGEVPRARFDADALYDPDPDAAGKILNRCGSFLEDIDCFDPELFGISPLEAASMDPQQRILLEVAWEAFEDAGVNPLGSQGQRVGVYVGLMYQDHLTRQLREFGREGIGPYLGTGSTFSAVAGRVSYVLGLRGPSLVVDTACSSSLVSVHLACQALRAGECDVALAGGVNVILTPEPTINLSRARMMSPTGRCRTFDASADGFTRGEGCGLVLLKPLSAARADSDRILGILRGSAVNQDGRSNGLTAPNGGAQRALFRDALAAAGVAAADVGYIECHGTGTPLGDPIEVGSIVDVFGDRPADRPLALGAVKTNFGHLESAAGICGLMKALLVLKHGEAPPNLHLRELNPQIRLKGRHIAIPTAVTPWFGNRRRFAAVNAFGFVGTNAQVILEGVGGGAEDARGLGDCAASRPVSPYEELPQVLPLSATGTSALADLCRRYAARLEGSGASDLADVCFTASVGRAPLRERIACVAADATEMAGLLREAAEGRTERVARGRAPLDATRPVLLFTGQGSLYLGAGRALYQSQPRFRAALDRHCEFLREHVGELLTEVLFATPERDRTAQTRFTQPILVALQLALLELWRHWGVEPAAVLGHSVGEISAAVAAGVLAAEDGLRLAAVRGRLMHEVPPGGGMAAVFAPAAWAQRAVADHPETLAVAGFNAPGETLISGALRDLLPLLDRARAEGVRAHRLAVSHAFHSPLMRPMLERFRTALTHIELRAPTLPLVSNLTGSFVDPEAIRRPDYWCEHVLAPVRFEDSVRTLAQAGFLRGLELGPQPTLAALAVQTAPEFVASPTLRRGRDDRETTCSTLAALYVDGVAIDWRAVHAESGRRRVAAPRYPFRRERHWLYRDGERPQPARAASVSSPPSKRLLGQCVEIAAGRKDLLVWEADADPARRRYLGEHALMGRAIWPVSAQIELALEAARVGLGVECCEIEDLELLETLYAGEEAAQRVQVQLERRTDGGGEVSVYARSTADEAATWRLRTRARVRGAPQAPRNPAAVFDAAPRPMPGAARAPLEFSLMFFAAIEQDTPGDRYRLVIEAARRADATGYGAIWVPERHFTHMGSLYPNPSVLHAALARETRRIHLRAGSVVLPLHHPIRVAEEWAMVDNLSNGRVGVSLAPGWNPADFVIAPGRYEDRYRDLYAGVEQLRRLWRGLPTAFGRAQVRIYPTPVQRELPIWITAARSPESFRQAGALGVNLLTHLLDQDIDALAEKIAVYRAARAAHGHDPDAGRVTVMCHTFLAVDIATVRRLARKPFCDYLKASKPLLRGLAQSRDRDVAIDSLSESDLQAFVEFLYERFEGTRALLGTPEGCLATTLRLRAAGADEIACLLDFGPDSAAVLAHLPQLDTLRDLHAKSCEQEAAGFDSNHDLVRAGLALATPVLPLVAASPLDVETLRAECPTRVLPASFYDALSARGVELSGSLRVLLQLAVGDGRAVALLPGHERGDGSQQVGTAFLDGCMQTALAALLHSVEASDPDAPFVPMRVGAVVLHRPIGEWPETDLCAFARIGPATETSRVGSVIATDAEGVPLLSIRDLAVRRLGSGLKDDEFAGWGYTVHWRPEQHQFPASTSCEGWIVLADEGGVAESWLEAAAGEPLCVRKFVDEVPGPGGERLVWLDKLDLTNSSGILCLWPLDTPDIADMDGLAVHEAQARGVATAVALAQVVARCVGPPPRIWIATRGAQAVTPADAVGGLAHAGLWGFAGSLARERPHSWGGIVDLDPALAPSAAAVELAGVLHAPRGEDQIAFRRGVRYARRLQRTPLAPARAPFRAHGKGAYLIAGGLGGLGLVVARWLVDRGARRLLLLGRSKVEVDDPRLAGLEALGAEVKYRAVDLGDAAALEHVLRDWQTSDQPGIRGVVHAADIFNDQLLEAIRPHDLEAGLRAKIIGAHTLQRVLGHLPLDFFLLFSSFSALIPPAGQAIYATAGAFLDGLAERRRAEGRTALSIDWGAWSEVGFASTEYGRAAHARLEVAGMRRMTPVQGAEVLQRLLAGDPPAHVGVLPGDLAALMRRDETLARLPLLREIVGEVNRETGPSATSPAAFLAKLKGRAIDDQRELLVDALRGLVATVLKQSFDRVEVDARLTNLGLDSLVAVQFKNRIGRELGLEISLVDLLRGASVGSIADGLLARIRVHALRPGVMAGVEEKARAGEELRDDFTL